MMHTKRYITLAMLLLSTLFLSSSTVEAAQEYLGSATYGRPTLIAGTDGVIIQTLKTDAEGNLKVTSISGSPLPVDLAPNSHLVVDSVASLPALVIASQAPVTVASLPSVVISSQAPVAISSLAPISIASAVPFALASGAVVSIVNPSDGTPLAINSSGNLQVATVGVVTRTVIQSSMTLSGAGSSTTAPLTNIAPFKEGLITVNCTASGGTVAAFIVTLQTSDDGGTTWYNMPNGTLGSLTGIGKQIIAITNFGDSIRAVATLTGTLSPSVTYTIRGTFKQ